MNKIKIWYDDDQEWDSLSKEQFEECFNFVTRPKFNLIREIYVHNASYNTWIEVVYNNCSRSVYNKKFGTFVKA